MSQRTLLHSTFFSSASLLSLTKDERGETKLHELVRHCADADAIIKFITEHAELAVMMAKQYNNDDDLPVHLLRFAKLSDPRRKLELECCLQQAMLSRKNIKPLTEKIDLTQIQSRYCLPQYSEKFKNNLQIAVAAANYARSIILLSRTHPDANSYSSEQILQIQDAMFYRSTRFRSASYTISFQEILRRTRQSRVGNCFEFAALVMNYLEESKYGGNVKMVAIAKKDHVFVVIGCDPAGDVTDYKNLGSDCFVCDAWIGDVYSIEDLEKYLIVPVQVFNEHLPHDASSLPLFQGVASFNPHCHKLEPNTSQVTDIPQFKSSSSLSM